MDVTTGYGRSAVLDLIRIQKPFTVNGFFARAKRNRFVFFFTDVKDNMSDPRYRWQSYQLRIISIGTISAKRFFRRHIVVIHCSFDSVPVYRAPRSHFLVFLIRRPLIPLQ